MTEYLCDPTIDQKACLTQLTDGLHPKSILEIGCGTGRLTEQLAELFPEAQVYGVDISMAMVEAARSRKGRVQYILGLGRTLEFKRNKFDLICSMLCFQHIETEGVKSYLSEAYRVLRSKGHLRFQFVASGEPGPMNHIHAGLPEFLREVGFSTVEVSQGVVMPEWTWISATK